MTVGQAQGGVGIRIDGLTIGKFHVHHALYPYLVGGIVVFIGIHHGNGGLKQAVRDGIFQQDHPVCINLVEAGLEDELGKVLLVAEDGMFKAGVDESVAVAFETLVYDLENTDALFGRDILHVDFQHFLANNTFHFGEGDRGKVAVGCLLKAVFSCCNLFLVLVLQGRYQSCGAGDTHEIESRHQCFLNGLLVVEGWTALLYDGAYLVECLLIAIVVQRASACQECLLLCTFSVQYFQTDETFVHTDGIFPVVGRRCILAGIVDAYGIVLQHLFHQSFLADIAHVVAHEVGGLHTFFHFVGNHVAPVASGKYHDEGKVALAITVKADGEMFLHF